jgi:prepilin-type N-terminal cleavage/methylation domain-containing protein
MSVVMKKTGFIMIDTRRKKHGFTLVELLTVMAIITMLVGLMVPSLGTMRRAAKEAKQRAQLATISAALTTFRNEQGYYPPSDGWYAAPPPGGPLNYGGAQKLAEALLGQDLLGFHPQSSWDYGHPVYNEATVGERRGRYLQLSTMNAFRIGNLFTDFGILAPQSYVLCDVFGAKKVRMGTSTVKAGTPILYYQAHTSGRSITQIYNNLDNVYLVSRGRITDGRDHPLNVTGGLADNQGFYSHITDPRVLVTDGWPHRPDSYLLITAGSDGLYGNSDDICNFGN